MINIIYLVVIMLLSIFSTNRKVSTVKKHDSFLTDNLIVSQQNNKTELAQLIDSVGAKMIKDILINSTSIAIYFDGEEYINHYGELEKGKGNTPSNETLYEIGSLSKVLTGTLIANAVLEKRISAEDDVNQF